MKLEIKFLLIALIAMILAVPVAFAMRHRTKLLNAQKSDNNHLRIQLQTKQEQLKQQDQDKTNLQKKIDDQAKQLQTKRDEAAKVAAAQAAPQAPTPAPVSVLGGNTVINTAGCEAYRSMVSQYGWPVNTAMAIMHAESGCNPGGPPSPTCDRGLMQVNCVHYAAVGAASALDSNGLAALYDPATNIRVAYSIYAAAHSFTPWTTFTSGAYLRYLQ